MKQKSSYFVKQILKVLEKLNAPSEEEDNSKKRNHHSSTTRISQDKQQCSIVLHKRQKNLERRAFKLYPNLDNNQVYKIFGIFGVNQKAIQNPGLQKSYFNSYLHNRVITKVINFDKAIILEMEPPSIPYNQPSLQYIIERFRSKGDMNFYQTAQLLEQMNSVYSNIQNGSIPDDKPETTYRLLEQLGDQMYTICLGVNKLGISKSLLNYLEYDLEEFCVEAIKYRSISLDLFSSLNYANAQKAIIKLMISLVKYHTGEMPLSQFNQSTSYSFTDFMTSSNNARSYCDMSFCFLNGSYFTHKINFIYYKEEADVPRSIKPQQNQIQREKERIRSQEYEVIKKIKNIPYYLDKERQHKIVGYKQVRKETEIQNQSQQ